MFSFLNSTNAKYEKIFYDFQINDINDEILDLSKFEGKTILLVNVASNCGFTKQYEGLQKLYDKYINKGLIVLGVPQINLEVKNLAQISKLRIFVKQTLI